MLRRAGIVGDVHGQVDRLRVALRVLEGAGVDRVLCVGDVPDGGGSATRCYELLDEHGVATVRGNHDRWILEGAMRDLPDADSLGALSPPARRFLASLGKRLDFETPLGGLLLCHGLGDNDMGQVLPHDEGYALETNDDLHAIVRDPRYRFVANGHTHSVMVRRFPGLTVLNAGTLLGNREPPGFVLADFDANEASLYVFTGEDRAGVTARAPLVDP